VHARRRHPIHNDVSPVTKGHCGIALLCGVLCVSEWSLGSEGDLPQGSISGIVVDAEGRAVVDVEVRRLDVDDKPVRTNAGGRFEMPMMDCSAQVSLVASDAGAERMGIWEVTSVTYLPSAVDARIVLRPSVTVRVCVVDAKGAPVPEADVMAVSNTNKAVASARTDGVGMAALRVPVDASIRNIFGMKAGAGLDYMENFPGLNPWVDLEPVPPDITLKLGGVRTMQVRALGTDGKPVAGIEFHPLWMKMSGRKYLLSLYFASYRERLARTTDASGVATFDYLPSTISQLVIEEDGGNYGTQRGASWQSRDDVPADDNPTVITTHVLHCQKLSGKVRLPDGKPAPGVLVTAQGRGYGLPSTFVTRTRADGGFNFRADSERSYLVGVKDERWAAKSLSGVVLKEGSDRDGLVLQLTHGTLVSGVVTDRLNGKPLGGQSVAIVEIGAKIDPAGLLAFDREQNAQEELRRRVATNAEGRYTIRLGPGIYRFEPYRVKPYRGPMKEIKDQAEAVQDLSADPYP
jgi:hypothetical protein